MADKAVAVLTLVSLLALGVPATRSYADPVADFYRGKTVNVLIGVGVGGEYDLQARMVARHLGRHIPGSPTVVPQNMIGAGGINPTFSTRGGNWRFHSKKTQKTRVQSREERGKAGVVKTKWLFTLRSSLTVRRHVLAIRTTN